MLDDPTLCSNLFFVRLKPKSVPQPKRKLATSAQKLKRLAIHLAVKKASRTGEQAVWVSAADVPSLHRWHKHEQRQGKRQTADAAASARSSSSQQHYNTSSQEQWSGYSNSQPPSWLPALQEEGDGSSSSQQQPTLQGERAIEVYAVM